MRTLRLEAGKGGVVVAFSPGGAFAETGDLADFFKRHAAGHIKILNIDRPDLAEVFQRWKERQ
jgi:hypothetical protein